MIGKANPGTMVANPGDYIEVKSQNCLCRFLHMEYMKWQVPASSLLCSGHQALVFVLLGIIYGEPGSQGAEGRGLEHAQGG